MCDPDVQGLLATELRPRKGRDDESGKSAFSYCDMAPRLAALDGGIHILVNPVLMRRLSLHCIEACGDSRPMGPEVGRSDKNEVHLVTREIAALQPSAGRAACGADEAVNDVLLPNGPQL